jgi:short-subunit dehydrogenase
MSKIALITGGSSGLGLAMVKNLGKKGYFCIIIARNKEKLDKAVYEAKLQGCEAAGFQCDTTDEEALNSVYKKIKEKFQKIDFLILNAGVVTCKLLSDFENTTELKHDLRINLWGTILTAYTFLPLLQSGSKLLMISSAFGLMGPAGYSVYSGSKAGIINFADSLRRELKSREISVHVACPADIDTPQLHKEHENMPEWIKQDDPRAKAMSADIAAEKILKKCFQNKFLIIISFEIFSLMMLIKFLPVSLKNFILDKMFPIP